MDVPGKREKETILVAAGIIERGGKILIARRREETHAGGKWEFPGGKLETGETPEECLKRELLEELGVDVAVGEFLGSFSHEYDDRTVELFAFRVAINSGEPRPIDHSEVAWVDRKDLLTYELAEADVPIAKIIQTGKR